MHGEIDQLLAAFRDWTGAGLALATVTETWGSAPRPRGSHMLIHADGRFTGSVSGGCVEGEVMAAAEDVIADGRHRLLRFGVADKTAWEAGLPCGGEIEILVQPVGETGFPPDLFEAIATARQAGKALTLATDIETGKTARDAGDETLFRRTYRPAHRLLIVGAVEIARSLVAIAGELGIACTVIDPRARFLTEARFPDCARDDRWPDEATAALAPDAATAVVTLSHDPKIDDPALIAALASPAGYVAALGSRRSHAARRERLQAAGLDDAALARIDAPAGLDIGAVGPAEIALSIAAGMTAAFAQNDPSRTSR